MRSQGQTPPLGHHALEEGAWKSLSPFQAVGDPGPGRDSGLGITESFVMVLEMHQKVFFSCFVIKAVLYKSETSLFLLK